MELVEFDTLRPVSYKAQAATYNLKMECNGPRPAKREQRTYAEMVEQNIEMAEMAITYSMGPVLVGCMAGP